MNRDVRNDPDSLPDRVPDRPEEDPLVDLPLGPQGESSPGPDPTEAAQGGSPPPDRPDAPSRRRWLSPLLLGLGALVLVAIGLAVGFLWPRGAPPVARLSTSLLDFGPQPVQAEGTPLEVVVSNGGTRPLQLASVALVGAVPEDFRLVADGCSGRTLDAEGQCTVLVGFQPSGAPGARSASLEVVGDFGNSPVQAPLLGTSVAPVLSLNRHRVGFPARSLGEGSVDPDTERLVISNRGTAPLELGGISVEGASADDFPRTADFCTGRTLRPEERCVVEIGFAPRAEGERRAGLVVTGRGVGESRVQLVGIGTAPAVRLAVDPERIDFGERSVGAPVEARAVTITNPAEVPVEVTEIEGPAEFPLIAESCRSQALAPRGGCALRIGWTSNQTGEQTGSLVVRYRSATESNTDPNTDLSTARESEPATDRGPESGPDPGPDPEAGEVRISLRGLAVAARLEIEPTELAFGEVAVSTESRRTVRLVNRGSGPARDFELATEGSGAAAFSMGAGSFGPEDVACVRAELPPGGECSLEVRFRPPTAGAHRARLEIRAGVGADPATPAPAVTLAGTGVAPRLVIRPERVDFGRVVVGESAERSVVLANEGRAPLVLGRLAPSGPAAREFRVTGGTCPTGDAARLAPGATCRVELRGSPRAPGRRTGRVSLAHDAPEGPQELTLAMTGLPAPKPELTVTPASLRFGDRTVGQRSGIETVRLRNTGNARLDLRGVGVDGADSGDFLLVPGTCDGLSFLAPGGDCTVGLRFAPEGPGSRRARLLIRHGETSGPRHGETTVALTGLGLEPAEVPGSR